MELIQMAREMGKEIQKSEVYKKLVEAKEKNDSDAELQDLIGQFNLKRITINNQINDNQKHDEDEMRRLDNELKDIYRKILANENMAAYNDSQNADGRSDESDQHDFNVQRQWRRPANLPQQAGNGGCSGSCASCSGCH